MSGSNGHSKRPIPKIRKKPKMTGLTKKTAQAATWVLFKRKGRNN